MAVIGTVDDQEAEKWKAYNLHTAHRGVEDLRTDALEETEMDLMTHKPRKRKADEEGDLELDHVAELEDAMPDMKTMRTKKARTVAPPPKWTSNNDIEARFHTGAENRFPPVFCPCPEPEERHQYPTPPISPSFTFDPLPLPAMGRDIDLLSSTSDAEELSHTYSPQPQHAEENEALMMHLHYDQQVTLITVTDEEEDETVDERRQPKRRKEALHGDPKRDGREMSVDIMSKDTIDTVDMETLGDIRSALGKFQISTGSENDDSYSIHVRRDACSDAVMAQNGVSGHPVSFYIRP